MVTSTVLILAALLVSSYGLSIPEEHKTEISPTESRAPTSSTGAPDEPSKELVAPVEHPDKKPDDLDRPHEDLMAIKTVKDEDHEHPGHDHSKTGHDHSEDHLQDEKQKHTASQGEASLITNDPQDRDEASKTEAPQDSAKKDEKLEVTDEEVSESLNN